jgi:hypothetical protein
MYVAKALALRAARTFWNRQTREPSLTWEEG